MRVFETPALLNLGVRSSSAESSHTIEGAKLAFLAKLK